MPETPSPHIETLSAHILVIDDDPQIRSLLMEYLTQNGLRVSIASTGGEMSKVLIDEAVDLVVLDLRLAGEDGMAMARSSFRPIFDTDSHAHRRARRSRPGDGSGTRRR